MGFGVGEIMGKTVMEKVEVPAAPAKVGEGKEKSEEKKDK